MKKTIACILFTAMLLCSLIPMTVSAATPNDYAEALDGYWNFEGEDAIYIYDAENNKSRKLAFKDTGSGSTVDNYLGEKGTVTYSGGKGYVPAVGGSYFTLECGGAELSTTTAITLGFKVMIEEGVGTSYLVGRANAYSIQAVHDATTGGYYLNWVNDALINRDICIAKVSGDAVLQYGVAYYFFFVVDSSAYTDVAKNDITFYYSTDGKTFKSNEVKGTEHWYSAASYTGTAHVEPGQVFRAGANGADSFLGKNNASAANASDMTFDEVWYFTEAVAAESLSTIALHKVSHAGNKETGTPAYRGCQTSAVSAGKFNTRFIATVDSVDYKEVGFEIQVTDYNGTSGDVKVYSTDTVYQAINGYDAVGGAVTYTAEELGGTYLYALTVNNIRTAHPATMRITPYYIALGSSERVYGTAYDVTVYNGSVVSQTVYTAPAVQ